MDFFIVNAESLSYFAVSAALLLTSFGFPLPEDIFLLAGGFIAAETTANIYIMIAVTMSSILIGDLIVYWLGYHFGKTLFSMRLFSWIFTPRRQERIGHFYAKYGRITIFLGRFAAGLRFGIYALAGAYRMKVSRFFVMDFLAALISVPFLVWVGYYFSAHIKAIAFFISDVKIVLFIAVVVAVLFIIVYRRIKRAKQVILTAGNDGKI